MKHLIAAILAFALLPLYGFAQMDGRKPGVYAIVGEESRPLPYSNSRTLVTSRDDFRVEIYRYRGETSGIEASHTFVLVVDPDRDSYGMTMNGDGYFYRMLTPVNMIFIPLRVNREENRREYMPPINALGLYSGKDCKEFDWERISENSFKVRVYGLTPGEYGIIFRRSKAYPFEFSGIYGFTINT